MFGSPQSLPSRTPSRTPSLLSLLRRNGNQCKSSPKQSSTPDLLSSQLAGMGLHSPQSSPGTPSASFTSLSTVTSSPLKRTKGLVRHQNRSHVYENVYQAKVKNDKRKMNATMTLRAYERQKRYGYQSSMADFEEYLSYFDKVKSAIPHDSNKVISPLAAIGNGSLRRALSHVRASMQERRPLKFDTLALDVLQKKWRQRDAELEKDLKSKTLPLPSHLPPTDETTVQRLLETRGQIAKFAREAVEDKDIVRLRPGQWLNDEVINFYGALLLCRSESSKESAPKTNGDLTDGPIEGRRAPLNAHYFSSFFWPKLTQDGYEKGRLAKWTKKIDVFSKDVVLIPVNHNNAHWTAAAINFRRKRLESYDSMGMAKEIVFTHLRKYLDAEHRNKKKVPFDFTGWENYAPDEITPQQENGYDCGVFTCAFLEALSRGEETFRFTQKDMPYLRRRMIWEIGNTTLRDD